MRWNRLIWTGATTAALAGLALGLWALHPFGGRGPVPGQAGVQSPGAESARIEGSAQDAAAFSRTETSTLFERAEVEVRRAEPVPRPGGGRADSGRVEETVEFTVRDPSGKVKQHKVLGR